MSRKLQYSQNTVPQIPAGAKMSLADTELMFKGQTSGYVAYQIDYTLVQDNFFTMDLIMVKLILIERMISLLLHRLEPLHWQTGRNVSTRF